MNDGTFEEVQYFMRNRVLWVAVGVLAVAMAMMTAALVRDWEILRNQSVFILGVIALAYGLVVGIGVLVAVGHMRTWVGASGVFVHFFPFHRTARCIRPADIDAWHAKTYRPILEYGGWGIRYGAGGKSYNVYGREGVLLKLKTGRSLLIGSQRPQELAAAVTAMMSHIPSTP